MSAPRRLAGLFGEDTEHHRALTGLRGWAALWVLLYHAWHFSTPRKIAVEVAGFEVDLTPFFSLGGTGVSIFFVLSGFLLALPYAEWQAGTRARPALGRYLFRRVARVFPAYYAQLAVLLLVASVIPGAWSGIADGTSLLRHLLMLFTPPPLGMTPINLVWWTLPIEFSFYLVLPLLAFLLRPERWWALLAAGLSTMWLWRHFVVTWLADASIQERVVASYQLPGVMDMFGIGMLAALLHVNRRRFAAWVMAPASSRQTWLGIAGLVAAIYWIYFWRTSYWTDHPIFYLWTPMLSLCIVALILAAVSGGRLMARLFGNRLMFFAGIVSYSVYLWHLPVLAWITRTAFWQGVDSYRLPILLAVSLPATLAVASLSYLLVERPFMRLRRGGRKSGG